MRFNDAIFGTALILFAIAEIAWTTTFPRLHGQQYGPDLFPVIVGAGMIVCGVMLVLKGYASRKTVPLVTVGDWAQDRNNVINVALLIGSIIFYILCSQWLGFIPCSILILVTLLVRLGTGWVPSIVIATVTTLVIHTLFAKILLVPLPWGVLLPLAW